MSPLLKHGTLDFISHSEAQTRRLGVRLASFLQPGDIIALVGDLGSGKTRWVQGICQGLGINVPVVSPTFTLVNEYEGRLPVYHIDLYRLDDTNEILSFGLDDYLYSNGLSLIEWADRADEVLAAACLTIELHHLEVTKRRVVLHAQGEQYATLLETYKKTIFAHPHDS